LNRGDFLLSLLNNTAVDLRARRRDNVDNICLVAMGRRPTATRVTSALYWMWTFFFRRGVVIPVWQKWHYARCHSTMELRWATFYHTWYPFSRGCVAVLQSGESMGDSDAEKVFSIPYSVCAV